MKQKHEFILIFTNCNTFAKTVDIKIVELNKYIDIVVYMEYLQYFNIFVFQLGNLFSHQEVHYQSISQSNKS